MLGKFRFSHKHPETFQIQGIRWSLNNHKKKNRWLKKKIVIID